MAKLSPKMPKVMPKMKPEMAKVRSKMAKMRLLKPKLAKMTAQATGDPKFCSNFPPLGELFGSS